jgi:cobalt/nickel transport system permease protein
LLLLEPLVIGVAVLMLFQPDGGRVFLGILFKTNLCLLTTILLSSTTPFTEMLRVLKQLHVPWLMVSTLTLMHRYLFVLADEAERMRRARASRTFTRRKRFQWRTLSTVAGQLFIRASERAERIYDAMCARGWK